MSHYYVCCDLGSENARVTLGTLERGRLTIGEISRFKNVTQRDKDALQWDIGSLFQDTLSALWETGRFDEPVDSVSCTSWSGDYLLFDSGGALIGPVYHGDNRSGRRGMEEVMSRVELETIYRETGVASAPGNTLFQLGGEKGRRLRRAARLLPVADAFNYLLSGVPCVEVSQASATQLFNPVTRDWSQRMLEALRLSPELLPPVVASGTELGALSPGIASQTGLLEARVVASCSHEIAAAIMGLPTATDDCWAYLNIGSDSQMGTQLPRPIISRESRELDFTNELGHGGVVRFSKRMPGLWLLEECRRAWKERDRELDGDVLMHLAACSEPFESLLNPADECFYSGDDLPTKIQEYCRRTGQTVPRKPGAIARCILESLALYSRTTMEQLERITGRKFTHVHLIGNASNSLLNHFTANALQLPLIVAPPDATTAGNVLVQAMALGHVKSLEEGRAILRDSFKTQSINPHAVVWQSAYDRFAELGTVQDASQAVAA
ncbi:MAG TPA: FGGY family carbohydrate kinase [Verrucomicrobiota bacterium]|nr:FGGY family carbohydrate kinase [Verrucomicrobiota bacterium]